MAPLPAQVADALPRSALDEPVVLVGRRRASTYRRAEQLRQLCEWWRPPPAEMVGRRPLQSRPRGDALAHSDDARALLQLEQRPRARGRAHEARVRAVVTEIRRRRRAERPRPRLRKE